jgi:hypothetical protein
VTDSDGSVVELAKLQEDGTYAEAEAQPAGDLAEEAEEQPDLDPVQTPSA